MPSMTSWGSFTDGTVVHQAALNTITTNGDSLTQITTGKTSASGVSSKPITDVFLNANMLVNDSTDTIVTWNASGYDTDGMWNAGAPTHLTVQTSGKYRISCGMDWGGNATGMRACKIMVNGTSNVNVVSAMSIGASPNFDTVITAQIVIPIGAGGTIYLDCFQNSGVTSNIGTSFGGTWMVAEWVSP